MRRCIMTFAAVLLASSIAPANAQVTGTPGYSNTAGKNRENMNQLICKEQTELNSRFKRKYCGTREQWERYRHYQQLVAAEVLNGQGYNSR